jgi:hypothetical protein
MEQNYDCEISGAIVFLLYRQFLHPMKSGENRRATQRPAMTKVTGAGQSTGTMTSSSWWNRGWQRLILRPNDTSIVPQSDVIAVKLRWTFSWTFRR